MKKTRKMRNKKEETFEELKKINSKKTSKKERSHKEIIYE